MASMKNPDPTYTQASTNKGEITHAAVGIVQRDNGLVLLAERPAGKAWAGYWEFPGGKIEQSETPEAALKRELKEELGIVATLIYPWLIRTFDYEAKYDKSGKLQSAAKTVKLHFFIVAKWEGEPFGMEKQTISWQNPEKVAVSPMLPANAPIFSALGLAPVYAISNLSELGEEVFFERLKFALNSGLMMLQIREKHLPPEELREFVERVIEVTEPYEAKVFINTDVNLAVEAKASGVHFSSHDLMKLETKPEGLLCGASCHTEEELAQAKALGLDYVLLSPVQKTPSHPNAEVLGWDGFSEKMVDCSIPVYALGGMHMDDLNTARLKGAHGIAMQRNIW